MELTSISPVGGDPLRWASASHCFIFANFVLADGSPADSLPGARPQCTIRLGSPPGCEWPRITNLGEATVDVGWLLS